jgi:hypothetical protein
MIENVHFEVNRNNTGITESEERDDSPQTKNNENATTTFFILSIMVFDH